jgi:hypothetical protein
MNPAFPGQTSAAASANGERWISVSNAPATYASKRSDTGPHYSGGTNGGYINQYPKRADLPTIF